MKTRLTYLQAGFLPSGQQYIQYTVYQSYIVGVAMFPSVLPVGVDFKMLRQTETL